MKKFTLFLMSMFLFLGTAMAQSYSLTETVISSDELNAKTTIKPMIIRPQSQNGSGTKEYEDSVGAYTEMPYMRCAYDNESAL